MKSKVRFINNALMVYVPGNSPRSYEKAHAIRFDSSPMNLFQISMPTTCIVNLSEPIGTLETL